MEPSIRALRRWRDEWLRAPIWAEIEAPPPAQALARVQEVDPEAALLESVQIGGRTGRHSVLGVGPAATEFWSRGRRAWLSTSGRTVLLDDAPIAILRRLLRDRRAPDVAELPPFSGGAIGLLSYDLAHQFERLPMTAHDDLGLPDIWLRWYDRCVVWDHAQRRALAIASVPLQGDIDAALRDAQDQLAALTEILGPPSAARDRECEPLAWAVTAGGCGHDPAAVWADPARRDRHA